MAILDLQQRIRELGRIRIGETKPTNSGKTRPAKLDRFRLTSASRPLLEQVAQLYGGDVKDWQPQGGGAKAFELYTTTNRIPVLVPPQPVTQFYELWQAGGCKRRCDGATELLSDRPCLCAAAGQEGRDRACKPTTRLNVVLRDVPGIGVWRLESHGYYAAIELPQAALFLAQAGGYVDGFLALEPRRVKRETADGKTETRDFMVPVLEVAITPAELMAGGGAIRPQLGQSPQDAAKALGSGAHPASAMVDHQPAIAAPVPDYRSMAMAAADLAAVKAIWAQAKAAGHLDDEQLQADLMEIGNSKLHQPTESATAAEPPAAQSKDALWMQIVAKAGDLDWTTADLENDFWIAQGTTPADATAEQMQAYLTTLTTGSAA